MDQVLSCQYYIQAPVMFTSRLPAKPTRAEKAVNSFNLQDNFYSTPLCLILNAAFKINLLSLAVGLPARIIRCTD